ncbi:hypothetical protein FC43_GL000540 [Limosilactobacillus ingluviei DSM 15946]|uniref:Uncharacterized protein n=1 Tax=Limosilactobacillus ingluviei DSM 15946 TaxID=1423760 RepID=A0A0R1UF23_9LACO|nr:hypothetical protein FC43_GL000540 [Limosilactobacillus ingluviei DSM 15946]
MTLSILINSSPRCLEKIELRGIFKILLFAFYGLLRRRLAIMFINLKKQDLFYKTL